MKLIKKKTAIVTGAGQGIGLEVAKVLLENGANVVINDLNPDLLNQASLGLAKYQERLVFAPGDASSKQFCQKLVALATAQFGKLHMVVANAGITIAGPFLEFQETDLRKMFELNVFGSFFLAQAAAQVMKDQREGGRILLMSSVTGIQAIKDLEGYSMTKAALKMFSKTLGVELAPFGITVNSVAPGATLTERTMEAPQYAEGWGKLIPTGRTAHTKDIANACLYLLGPNAGQVTGQTLVVDGGWTATGTLPEHV